MILGEIIRENLLRSQVDKCSLDRKINKKETKEEKN